MVGPLRSRKGRIPLTPHFGNQTSTSVHFPLLFPMMVFPGHHMLSFYHGGSNPTPYVVASGSSETLLIAGSQIVDGVGARAPAVGVRANRLSSSLTACGPSNLDPKPESERSHVSSLVVSPLLPNVAPYPQGTPTTNSGLHSLFQNDIQAWQRVAFGSEATSVIGVALVLLGGLLGTVGIYVCHGIRNAREERWYVDLRLPGGLRPCLSCLPRLGVPRM
ncbi:hypothetical protein EDD17DRAFT_1548231 [Pisolithus thermaeus]|nr:hypothetical protein EDD17DRAFT_1548231 [Pisolithus thermaeus]